jgi:putative SOS response-associated peptidase YedK
LTQFAEPDGPKGWKTRTWFGVKGWPIFAWAGFCRRTEEWGLVFAGMTTASNESIMPLNDRMPVLLKPEEYDQWRRARFVT